jgi:uncharacterized protein (TIGR00297 family)
VTYVKQPWQSKLVLLLVLPALAAAAVLQAHFYAENFPQIAIWTLGLSLLLGLAVLQLRSATPGAAFTGAVINASLMFSTARLPYKPWQTAIVPFLAVFLLSDFATRIGRQKKQQLGVAESIKGRVASQVAANLGFAALVSLEFSQNWLLNTGWFPAAAIRPELLFSAGTAALAEAAADTVSSEVGQVFGGRPRMITTLRLADPGTDGAISLAGTMAGILAAILVAAAGAFAIHGGLQVFWIGLAGAVFGLFFDSLLGATLERSGWLNNDAVNFLSTAGAAAIAIVLLHLLPAAY